jgi:hypothetical protein
MRALFLHSLLLAVLVGPTIGLATKFTTLQGGIKYDPPMSEAEFHQMRNMTVNEMEATLAKRRIRITRWELLRESVSYSYFWKQVAHDAIIPSCGVFVACMCLGFIERKRLAPDGI